MVNLQNYLIFGLIFVSCTSFIIQYRGNLNIQPYNETIAKNNAYLSMITHCTKSQIQTWTCKLCNSYKISEVKQVENTTTEISGFIGYDSHRNEIIISWRGTTDMKNWEQDFKFDKLKYQPKGVKCDGCQIHSGFYKSYRSVAIEVQKLVNNLITKYPTAKIVPTGHSLGGALAVITALELSLIYPKKVQSIYNYGCPRLGNLQLMNYLKTIVPTIYRIVHYKDLVPHLPPVDFKYMHAAHEVLYDQQMKTYKICDDSGEDKSCSDGFAPNFDPKDHTFYWVNTDSSVC